MTPSAIDVIDPRDDIYTYALLCQRLRDALNIKEACQFMIGDELLKTETIYAARTIRGLAADIGVSSQSLYAYRDLSEFYPADIREHYKAKGLYYSHLRLARSLGTLEAAMDFLEACDANHWSVALAQLELARLKGRVIALMPRYVTCTFHREGTRLYIETDEIQVSEGVEYDILVRERR